MILLVVPRGFSTGTELLKTSAHRSQTDLPMVNLEPPDSETKKKGNRSPEENNDRAYAITNWGRNKSSDS